MNIGAHQLDAMHPPYIIAELGVNHDGSVDRAMELVTAAKQAGADAIKLQLFETDRLLSKAAKLAAYQVDSGADDPFKMLRSLELSVDQMAPIVKSAHEHNLHAIVTVFSVELVEPANRLNWDAYKTASPDLINRPLIEAMLATRRPLLISTGASTLEEIRQTKSWLSQHPHIFMHCVSAYPTPDACITLAVRSAMGSVDPNVIGFSDHTTAVDTGAIAVATGARVLEKHLTYDRSAFGPDHATSLDPAGFAEYVRLSHRAFSMLGEPRKRVLEIEQDVREVSRQSITSVRDLPIGHAIARQDLTIKRPGTGISPARLQAVIGRRVRRPVEADMPLVEEDLA